MTPHADLEIPAFLCIPQEERRAAWKGRRLRPTSAMNFGRPARVEDPTTIRLRKEVEAAERAKAERKAQEKRDRQSLERRRANIVKQEIAMAHSDVGPKQQQLRDLKLRNQKPVRIVKITTIEKPAPIIEAQPQETTTMAKTAKKTTKRHPNLPSTHPANRGPKQRAAKTKVPKPAKTARDPAAPKEIRPGSKLAIVVGLLTRKEGCTTAEALAATDWPAISFNQQAKAAGITLRKVKEGKVTRYYAA